MPKFTITDILLLTWAVASALSCINLPDISREAMASFSPWYSIPYFFIGMVLRINCLFGFMGCIFCCLVGLSVVMYYLNRKKGETFEEFLACKHYNIGIRDNRIYCRDRREDVGYTVVKDEERK